MEMAVIVRRRAPHGFFRAQSRRLKVSSIAPGEIRRHWFSRRHGGSTSGSSSRERARWALIVASRAA